MSQVRDSLAKLCASADDIGLKVWISEHPLTHRRQYRLCHKAMLATRVGSESLFTASSIREARIFLNGFVAGLMETAP